MFSNFQFKNISLNIQNSYIEFHKPLIMGIANTSPDSFYDGSTSIDNKDIEFKINKMIEEGAEIIDIGGQSTKPGSKEIEIKEEITRTSKWVEYIKKKFPKILVSIDTYKSEVAKAAIDCGVDILNDISAGLFDEKIPFLAADNKLVFIAMHTSAKPEIMQQKTNYYNVTNDVFTFLESRINYFKTINLNAIIIDVGFGFGKNLEQNYQLLKELIQFQKLDKPILVGLSRKSMIYKTLNISPETSLNATTIVNTIALFSGAQIFRVHDVKECKEIFDICEKLKIYKKDFG